MTEEIGNPLIGGLRVNRAEALIALAQLMLHWKSKIEEALEHAGNPYTFDQLVDMVMLGKLHLFPYEKCCLLCETIEFGQFKSYHVMIAVGDMQEVLSSRTDVDRVAENLGCQRITANGRKGWPRIAEKYGWKHISSVIAKEL